MGCCGSDEVDHEINNAKSINDLIAIITERKQKIPNEIQQISDHLEDPSKEVEGINVDKIDPEVLAKRIPYLKSLEEAYEQVIKNLNNHKDLPLKDIKGYCANICKKYYLTYDPNKELDAELQKFDDFVNKQKTN